MIRSGGGCGPTRRRHSSSLAAAHDNIHRHYDLGNDFYAAWLDREAMQYTCAYFPEPGMTLEAAQRAKMDHVCRKLRLRPGQRVFEAGCGWGGFALHMAREYGVEVRACNISREQVRYATERAREQGLGRPRQLRRGRLPQHARARKCDAFVSIGMLEHVGPENYGALGEVIDRCLAPQGLGLIHTIGRNRPEPMNGWIERRIFPGAQPPSLGQMMAIFEPHAFSVLDVENLRLHYAETLRHWIARYLAAIDAVRATRGADFARAWHLYLAGSIAAFTTGDHAAVPGAVRARRQQRPAGDAPSPLRVSARGAPRRGDRRRRAGRLDAGARPGARGRDASACSTSACSRATRPAPAGSRRR